MPHHDHRAPLRLMIYDRTCTGRGPLLGLSHAWSIGGRLYRALGRLDACRGVSSWTEALTWLTQIEPERTIGEVQFWGHGKWGLARIDKEPLDTAALTQGSPLRPLLDRVRDRIDSPQATWWFRTCETFGARPGHAFARAFTETMGCRAAGHTYIIGHWQSGLHTLEPGHEPTWPEDEALLEGTPDAPTRAFWSRRSAPNTITFLHGRIPDGY
jgi:hypothetical protein